jgi:L-aspartate semialdehyde sulfurtransferase
VDYSDSYPQCIPGSIGEVNYKQLKSGRITVQGKEIPTSGLSSYLKAREIAQILKEWVEAGKFFLTQPVELLPSADSGIVFKALKERPIKKKE